MYESVNTITKKRNNIQRQTFVCELCTEIVNLYLFLDKIRQPHDCLTVCLSVSVVSTITQKRNELEALNFVYNLYFKTADQFLVPIPSTGSLSICCPVCMCENTLPKKHNDLERLNFVYGHYPKL